MVMQKSNTFSGILAGIQIIIPVFFVGILIAVEISEMQDSGVFFRHLASLLLIYLLGPIVVGLEGILFFIKFLLSPKTNRIITAIRIVDGVFGAIILLLHVWSILATVPDEIQVLVIVLSVITVILFLAEAVVRGIPKIKKFFCGVSNK